MMPAMQAFACVLALLIPAAQAASPSNPYDGQAWRASAEAQLASGDADAAMASLRKAIELGALSEAEGLVEIAAAQAAAGRSGDAMAVLGEAIAAGYRFRAALARDKRFASLPADTLARIAGTARSAEPGTPAARTADLQFLLGEIRRLHPRFASGDPAAFSKVLASVERELSGLSDSQFVIALQRLLAAAGDGHTIVYPFGMTQGSLTRVPATLYWFDDGIYIVDAAESELRGARLMAIDREPVEEVLARMRPLLSVENDMQFRWAAPLYLTFPAFTSRDASQSATATWSVSKDGALRDVTVTHAPIDPATLDTKLPAPPAVAAPRYLARRDETAWFEPLEPRALYVQINAIADSDGESLEAFARRLSKTLHSGEWDAAIVDLRNNSGGDASLADALLKTLVSFDERGGRLVVLTSRITFSAAQTLAARLDAWTAATFVGEPTGSRVNRYGNEAPFRLPHSGIRGTISSGWNQPVTSRDHRIWIAPDVPAPMISRDYFAGADPVFERALLELRRQP